MLPQAVKVPRGEPVEIALRIYGVKNEPLKYLIRTPPKSGKLTEPRVLEREVSAVTYTPPADLAVTRDRFSYAVQNGAGVSASVDVLITIVDQPPDLALPGALDFAPMLAGATAAKTVEIRNRGGGLAEGQVAVEAPWKIEGAARYRLAAGARAVFKVVFAPEKGGVFESAVRFSSQPESGVRVRGEAQEAIAAAPAKIELQNAAGDAVRTGAFELTNQTDAECRVTLSGGARLQVPAELTVPAHGKVSVPVQTAATDVTALDGEVRAESAGLTVRVPVRAARVGPLVRSVRGPVMFGRVDAARAAGADFELENFGGTAADVSWEIGAPFVMEQPSARLAPGEKKTLTLRMQPAAAGKYRAWLTVQCNRQKLEIPVEAELFAKAAPAAASRANVAASLAREPDTPAPEALIAATPELTVPSAEPASPETPAAPPEAQARWHLRANRTRGGTRRNRREAAALLRERRPRRNRTVRRQWQRALLIGARHACQLHGCAGQHRALYHRNHRPVEQAGRLRANGRLGSRAAQRR